MDHGPVQVLWLGWDDHVHCHILSGQQWPDGWDGDHVQLDPDHCGVGGGLQPPTGQGVVYHRT